MYTLEQLVDTLDFKREVMTQVPLVSTLLAGLAMSGVLVLISSHERSRLRSWLLILLTISSLVFILTTVLDAAILPGMQRFGTRGNAGQIEGLLNLSEVVVWGLLFGIACLMGAICGLGFMYSRRVGLWALGAAGVLIGLFVACCFYLDAVMRR